MSTYEATTADPLKSLWWLLILFGVIVFGVGVFFLVSPHETLETFTVIAGILLLFDGALAIIASIVGRGEGRGLLAMIGVLSAIAGLVLIKKPFDTLVVFTVVFGIWLVVAGVVRFVTAFSLVEGRGGSIALAILDVGRRDRDPLVAGHRAHDARGDHRHRADPPRAAVDRRGLDAAPSHRLSIRLRRVL